ncbi:hypothetical protein [Achromobacter dolens]|uniref:endonuclease toxin domain-containing protein n=1 Tax=Achromobacter dolens TaxID=1287738 RepID=UPI0015842A58|nr:hypothetical protein [Achromobacter dolens]
MYKRNCNGEGDRSAGQTIRSFRSGEITAGTRDLNAVKSNFLNFDHLTPDGTAISTQTLGTGVKTYQQPAAITRTLNKYVDDMVEFTRDGAQGEMIYGSSFAGREMHLAVPASTTAEQFSAIAKTIEYAKQFDIK